MSRTVAISRLRIGQRFSWIPAAWYGPCRLTVKYKDDQGGYTLKFDAKVVNPPGVEYGVPGKTRVRLLKPKKGDRG